MQFGLAKSYRIKLHTLTACVIAETLLGILGLIWCPADGLDLELMNEEKLHQGQ